MSDGVHPALVVVAIWAVAVVCIVLAVTLGTDETTQTSYDYEQITACLDARGFPFDTIAEASKSLRFCIEFDQALRGQR